MNSHRRYFGCVACRLALLPLLGNAWARDDLSDAVLTPGYRPPERSDERELWSMMDRAERELQRSLFVIRDPALDDFVQSVICRLAKDHCSDIRAYIVRTPQFNASMAPNGMMQIWTGLLLRCSDESQLAAIIAHEMGHYLKGHSIQRYRELRDKASLDAILGIGLAAAGVGWAGIFTNLALMASIFSYTREQERQADLVGLDLMTKAGYAPHAAPEVWAQLIAEYEASTAQKSKNVMFASHPAPDERLAILQRRVRGGDPRGGYRGRDRFRDALAVVRQDLLKDELVLRQFGRSEVVFDRLIVQNPDDALLWFSKGEVYRLRAQSDDLDLAMRAYEKALATNDAPPQTYRSIALVEFKRGSIERARGALNTYLKNVPGAADAEGLRMLIGQ